eukprot:UN02910
MEVTRKTYKEQLQMAFVKKFANKKKDLEGRELKLEEQEKKCEAVKEKTVRKVKLLQEKIERFKQNKKIFKRKNVYLWMKNHNFNFNLLSVLLLHLTLPNLQRKEKFCETD